MNIQHLHIHVRDRAVSEAFYAKWLSLRVARRGSSLTFMTDTRGFDLALMADVQPTALPEWFHFGCRLPSAHAVTELHAAMLRDGGVPIAMDLYQDEGLVSFKAKDPDGYRIEFYWEAANAPLD
jgi:catechol 2,3-dioxygenase-like lactoylglutathione lyase family enzyme